MRMNCFFLLTLLSSLSVYADEKQNSGYRINLEEIVRANATITPSEAEKRILEISTIFEECCNSQVLAGNTREQLKRRSCIQSSLKEADALVNMVNLPFLTLPKKFTYALKAYEALSKIRRILYDGTIEGDIMEVRNDVKHNLDLAGLEPEDIGALPGELDI